MNNDIKTSCCKSGNIPHEIEGLKGRLEEFFKNVVSRTTKIPSENIKKTKKSKRKG